MTLVFTEIKRDFDKKANAFKQRSGRKLLKSCLRLLLAIPFDNHKLKKLDDDISCQQLPPQTIVSKHFFPTEIIII